MPTFLKLIISITVSLSAGVIGAFFTTPSVKAWYPTLLKPSFNPPNWLFGPVWTLLYILMGIALFLVWNAPGANEEQKNNAMTIFFIQLALNTLWSIVFFGMHSIVGGLFVILFLSSFIIWTTVCFMLISKTAGWLMAPYILWVSFATVLNAAIWKLNK
ncbi:MAG: TspO/MBR family protein [Elusimicrobiota bacterium]